MLLRAMSAESSGADRKVRSNKREVLLRSEVQLVNKSRAQPCCSCRRVKACVKPERRFEAEDPRTHDETHLQLPRISSLSIAESW